MASGSVIFWQDPTWIGAATGFMALVFSFFSLRYQKHLLGFQTKVSLKEKLVSELKDNVASIITYSAIINDTLEMGDALQRVIEAGKATAEQIQEEKKLSEDYKLYRHELFKLNQKLAIFLDEKNEAHVKLDRELKSLVAHCYAWRKTDVLNEEHRQAFLLQGMEIQKRITDATRELAAHELKEILKS